MAADQSGPRLVGSHYVHDGLSYTRATTVLKYVNDGPDSDEILYKLGWKVYIVRDGVDPKLAKLKWDDVRKRPEYTPEFDEEILTLGWREYRQRGADSSVLGTRIHAEIEKFRNWTVEQAQWAAKRVERLEDGAELPGVFGSCEQFLEGPENAPKFDLIGGPYVQFDPELLEYVRPYIAEWFIPYVAEAVLTEKTIWSKKWAVAGTLDGLDLLNHAGWLRFRAQLVIEDLKSSRFLKWKYRLQTACYWHLLLDSQGIEADGLRLIVNLPSDRPGTVRIKKHPYLTDDWNAYRAAMYLAKYGAWLKDDWKSGFD